MDNNKFAEILSQYPDLEYQLKNPVRRVNYSELKDEYSGKVRYETSDEARLALSSCRSAKRHGSGRRKECAIYQDDDGGWYLTSKSRHRRVNKTVNSKKHFKFSPNNKTKKKANKLYYV